MISLIGLQARSETFSCNVHDAVIVATDTSIVCLMDGKEIAMDLPDGMRIRGLDSFGDGVIAIAEGGCILFWDSPFDKARRRDYGTEGEFIGIDAWENTCYAISDSSEIISLDLALQGKVFDFNTNYSEYYGKINAISIAAGPSAVCMAGTREDGYPAVFISSKGSVWSERELNYSVNGQMHMFDTIPYEVIYEEASDSFVLICDEGIRFHLPSCSHCNYIEKIW